jgi:hypothetical protein
MPQLEITESELIVHLDEWEQFFSFIHKVKVPLAQIVSVRENNGLDDLKLGWRLPGTHVPFLIAAGTFISKGARQFVYRRRGLQTVVIDLEGHEWARLIIGMNNAAEEALRVESAISSCPK